jgi:hypothetical protein
VVNSVASYADCIEIIGSKRLMGVTVKFMLEESSKKVFLKLWYEVLNIKQAYYRNNFGKVTQSHTFFAGSAGLSFGGVTKEKILRGLFRDCDIE